MSSTLQDTKPSSPAALSANLSCFAAMGMWAVGFPAAEILLESWGTVSLVLVRQLMAVALLLLFWVMADGWAQLRAAPWARGLVVGGIGFGIGAILLLIGQKMSDPVTPAIAAAMMPIVGAALEVILDGRRLRPHLILGIMLALSGGYLATGVNLSDGSFGIGALLCLGAVILFAWGTRATTREFPGLSPIGQTTLTLCGGMSLMLIVYLVLLPGGFQATEIGLTDSRHIILMLIFSLVSLAIPQLLWIWGAGRLGILLASFHMNAVPFYVMVTMVLLLGEEWNSMQAVGAAIVAAGVMIAQSARLNKADI